MLYRGIIKFDNGSEVESFTFDAPNDESAKWTCAILFSGLIQTRGIDDISSFTLRFISRPGEDWMDPEEQYEKVLTLVNSIMVKKNSIPAKAYVRYDQKCHLCGAVLVQRDGGDENDLFCPEGCIL